MEPVAITVNMESKYLFRFMLLNSTYGLLNKIVWGISLLCLVLFPFSFFYGNPITILALGIIVFMNIIMKAVNFLAKAKQQMLTNQLFRAPMNYVFDHEGASLNDSEEKVLWDQLIGVKETGKLFLLYIQPLQAFIIPKDMFTSEQHLADFKQLLEEAPLGVKKLKDK